jgi:hypothetical protein
VYIFSMLKEHRVFIVSSVVFSFNLLFNKRSFLCLMYYVVG